MVVEFISMVNSPTGNKSEEYDAQRGSHERSILQEPRT